MWVTSFYKMNAQDNQQSIKIGVAYGFSDWLRGEQQSYFDYSIQDYRLSIGLESPVEYRPIKNLEITKTIEALLIQSDYQFYSEEIDNKVYRVEVQPSYSLNYYVSNKFITNLKGSIGFGYGGHYHKRLPEGFFFVENISIGFKYQLDTNNSLQLSGEYQHISNLNFYKLNRGLDLNYVHLQWKHTFR